jgi:ribosome recycling factor
MLQPILDDAKRHMEKAIEALRRELAVVRTGKASVALVEHIPVEYYGTTLPLNQLASISVPEARLIIIQPWDKQAVQPIEKAILKSELGLTPTNDGTAIRLSLPQPSEERRKELVKLVRKRSEVTRVEIRNFRRHALESLKKLEKSSGVSEDEVKRAEEQLQKLTDKEIERVDQLLAEKEQEIMTV